MSREWLYPTIIAHRGGGSLAPENTLSAIDASICYGQKMIEVDAKLSADGQIFLLHDDTLDRTSQDRGIAGLLDWHALSTIDVGVWFDQAFRGERLPLLSSIAKHCRKHGLAINIDIKPTSGTEQETGRAVALAARLHWEGMTPPPLLSSFSLSALLAAKRAAPELPRGLLLEEWRDDWKALSETLACRALHFQHEALTENRVEAIKASGLHVLGWVVNSPYRTRTLLGWGVDTICTDRIDLIDADFANS
ncbi:glycerophosphodiester phosphodiesterase [secondary endosymbiont of Ctenarytaina eucalypti]|uniref:Glycerophosphoryl diester phosphodiesterase n=1 Tax=secondary endosymbiont of Ctenarytaina eucalypti TaxID=1199245 RepID=J3VSW3_9ENTR|nr:glycerophosphodiester phosphodiesterase [secondary endosymbiont of Ctenarytaina eucalypti]AFP85046.1 glycerophosphoryl diester phosphodiesterase [secondary endosymbiont of Ctenarytaina eucalypti]